MTSSSPAGGSLNWLEGLAGRREGGKMEGEREGRRGEGEERRREEGRYVVRMAATPRSTIENPARSRPSSVSLSPARYLDSVALAVLLDGLEGLHS